MLRAHRTAHREELHRLLGALRRDGYSVPQHGRQRTGIRGNCRAYEQTQSAFFKRSSRSRQARRRAETSAAIIGRILIHSTENTRAQSAGRRPREPLQSSSACTRQAQSALSRSCAARRQGARGGSGSPGHEEEIARFTNQVDVRLLEVRGCAPCSPRSGGENAGEVNAVDGVDLRSRRGARSASSAIGLRQERHRAEHHGAGAHAARPIAAGEILVEAKIC